MPMNEKLWIDSPNRKKLGATYYIYMPLSKTCVNNKLLKRVASSANAKKSWDNLRVLVFLGLHDPQLWEIFITTTSRFLHVLI